MIHDVPKLPEFPVTVPSSSSLLSGSTSTNPPSKNNCGTTTKPTSKHRLSTENTVPIFLRKTFTMMNTCDTKIASWSDDGRMIVIKDTKLFASEIIPQHFKHNNLSSFVRQLNFYGFRKLRTTHDDDDPEHNFWFFHHENFIRGRSDLLCKIRKTTSSHSSNHQQRKQQRPGDNGFGTGIVGSTDTDQLQDKSSLLYSSALSATQEEVKALKDEVSSLKACIANMSTDMQKLAFVVQTMYNENKKRRQQDDDDNIAEKTSKKIKMINMNVGSIHLEHTTASPSLSSRDNNISSDESHDTHEEEAHPVDESFLSALDAALLVESYNADGHDHVISAASGGGVHQRYDSFLVGNIFEIQDLKADNITTLMPSVPL